MPDRRKDEERKGGVGLLEKEEIKTRKPPMYKVLIHNDDYTPVEWVIQVVHHVFRKPQEEAVRITLQVHQGGVGVAGIYTHEIAETKVAQVQQLAERDDFPLMCSLEPDE